MPKTLRQRAKEEPRLEVNRTEANELLDIAWENHLNDFELGPIWRDLEGLYGLKSHSRPGLPNSKYYYLEDIVEALARMSRREVCPSEPESEDYDPATFWDDVDFEFDDDAKVTAIEIAQALPIRAKKIGDVIKRLGVEPVGRVGRIPLYPFGEVKEAWIKRQITIDSDG